MEKKSVAEKVEWMKGSLDVMLKAASEDEYWAQGSALKMIDDLEKQVSQWMEAHYGDGE